jgi:hypothetical protein
MSMRRFKPASWLLLALAIAVPGAKADEVTPVAVSQTPSSIVVRVSRPTSLRTVLEVFCQRTAAQCDLTAVGADTLVPPATLTGAWNEIAFGLLEGSGFSYAATAPAPGRNARLFVEAPGPKEERPQPQGLTWEQATGIIDPTDELPTAQGTVVPEMATADAAPAETPAAPAPHEALASAVAPDSLQMPSGAAPPPVDMVHTPFADPTGNPLVVPRITLPPGVVPTSAALPFPAKGSPSVVPIAGAPPPLLPFAGPDGQSIPAPPIIPGQKLEFPLPPP